MQALAVYLKGVGETRFAWMVKLEREFLVRLQNEGTKMHKRCPADLTKLPPYKRNGSFVEVDGESKLVCNEDEMQMQTK